MSRPSNVIVPSLGAISPASRLKSVVFPAPFGPMIACSVPLRTSRSTPSTATMPPNRFERLRALNMQQLHDTAAQHHDDRAEQDAEQQRPVRPNVTEPV